MRKDAKRYTDTEGWGWGRWRGLDLKPYGKDRRFVNECTDCHRPMRGNDYVYTLPITDARVKGNDVVNNSAAALPGEPALPTARMERDHDVRRSTGPHNGDAVRK